MKIRAIDISRLDVATPPPRNTYYPNNSYVVVRVKTDEGIEGLGYTMVRAQRNLDATKVWAAVVVLTALGLLGTLLVTTAERRLLRWHPSSSRR